MTTPILLAIWLLSCAPTAQADPIDDAIAAIGGVPRSPHSPYKRLLAPDVPRLALIMAASDEKIDQLLTADSRSKSAAIMLLDARGRINALAAQAALIDSTEPAIPIPVGAALRPAIEDSRQYESRTVGQQISGTLRVWLGVRISSHADFQTKFAGVTDFNTLAGPWLWRLNLLQFNPNDAERTSIKQSILALNPETAWAVIAEAADPSFNLLSPSEASAMLNALPESLKTAIKGNDPINPPDPRYRAEGMKELVDRCRTRAKAILTPAAPD